MLTDKQLRALKPKAAVYRVADSGGLAIEVRTNGVCYWRYRYRFNGVAKMLSLGRYPEVSLREARQVRDKARKTLRAGTDPSEQRKQAKSDAKQAAANNFEAVARKWMERQDVAEATAIKNRWLLETFAFPAIGRRPIAEITLREILTLLRKIESAGKLETTQRLKQKIGRICRCAVIEGIARIDPTSSLRGAIKTPKTHLATMPRSRNRRLSVDCCGRLAALRILAKMNSDSGRT